MDRQPETAWPRVCLQDPVLGMGRNGKKITRAQVNPFPSHLEHGPALQQHDPFILILVIEAGIRGVAADDALDTQATLAPEVLAGLPREGAGRDGEKIKGIHGEVDPKKHTPGSKQKTDPRPVLAYVALEE